MPLERKPTGAYDAAYPVNVPGGGTAYANATVAVDQNGNPISGGGGGAVTIADGADVAEGATTAAAYTDQTGAASGTVVGLLKGVYAALRGIVTSGGTFTTALPTLTNGQRSTLQLDGSGRLIVKIADSRFARSGFANGYNQFSSFNLFADDGGSGPLNVVSGYQDPASGNGFTARGDTNGAFTVSKGSNSFATAQVSVATSATQIVAARANRGSVKITNLGTNDVYIGVAGVTTTTGDLLPGTKGASIVVPTNAAVFGIAAAAQNVSVMEVF